ncbi:MAG: Response regulator rcp1 [Chloroflexi bacterium ADurb.Bin344]|nr:MAG: Response regulator rcp1 [Chloroflexi bacterium ADurb.Bin344]
MKRIIMLVEDNPDDITLAKRVFRKCNLTDNVVVTRDGVEALEYLLKKDEDDDDRSISDLPAVILMDLKMPRMDGIETLKVLRSSRKTAFIPVVMLTSSDEERDIRQCYQCGANSYIRKPIDFDRFSEVMQLLSVYWLTINELPGEKGI